MSELQRVFQQFQYEGKEVRTIVENGEVWFVAADLTTLLEIDSTQIRRIDADDRGMRSIQTLGGMQEMTVVNESGLYSLVLGSRKPEAKVFKKWVTSEVLPSIRKTGSYITPSAPPTHVEALRGWADALEVVETQKKALELAAPKVAFADAVNDSSNSMDLGVFAKILGTGRTRLFEWLREQKYFMPGSSKPYQRFVDNEYFVVIETTFAKGDMTQTYGKSQITGKGQLAIEKKWAESHGG